MSAVVERHNNLALAKSFLAAYWRADLAGALANCHADSVIDLARSLPILTPAPISVVLPLMFRDVFVRFTGGRFAADIDSVMADEQRVLIEYTARGTLVGRARPFECGYAVVFSMYGGAIAKIRAYADARYVSAPFVEV